MYTELKTDNFDAAARLLTEQSHSPSMVGCSPCGLLPAIR